MAERFSTSGASLESRDDRSIINTEVDVFEVKDKISECSTTIVESSGLKTRDDTARVIFVFASPGATSTEDLAGRSDEDSAPTFEGGVDVDSGVGRRRTGWFEVGGVSSGAPSVQLMMN